MLEASGLCLDKRTVCPFRCCPLQSHTGIQAFQSENQVIVYVLSLQIGIFLKLIFLWLLGSYEGMILMY